MSFLFVYLRSVNLYLKLEYAYEKTNFITTLDAACKCDKCTETEEDEIDIKSYFENKITRFNPEDEIDYPPEG